MSAVARKLESIREKGSLRHADIAEILGSRPETVSRWNNGHAYPKPSAEKLLLELEYIVDQLSGLYAPDEARQWMFAPQRLLNGDTPARLIQSGRMEEVMRLVGQLRDAVHM